MGWGRGGGWGGGGQNRGSRCLKSWMFCRFGVRVISLAKRGGGGGGGSVKIQLRRVNTRYIACSDIAVKTRKTNSPKEDRPVSSSGVGERRGIHITDTYALKR